MFIQAPQSRRFIARSLMAFLLSLSTPTFFGTGSLLAHSPDRCFHTHYNNTTSCKPGIRGKSCTVDASGRKGECTQISRQCYCKPYKSSSRKAKQLLNLGVAIGEIILEQKGRGRSHRDRREHYSDERPNR